MIFHLGRPLFAMGLLSLLGAAWLWKQPSSPAKDLTLWVFAEPHFDEYDRQLRPPFERLTGRSLAVELIPSRAMDMRLAALFMSPRQSHEMPDAVEIEIGSIGRYLRPPVDEAPFLPLNGYLKRGGWLDRILPSRLTPATKQGVIFAVPDDVHPVSLCFREDLFRAAGISLIDEAGRSTVSKWSEFQERCVAFQRYWRAHGFATRHAMELPESGAGALSILLLQRHLNLIDADDRIHLNDPKVAQTLAFYASAVAGPDRIGADAAADSGMELKDLADGNFCALLTPDWKVQELQRYVPELGGKLRMIPLPRFEAGDAPTASYGGTFIAIPRASAHPDQAWKLIEFIYFSPQGLAARSKLGILPPLPGEWDRPEYHLPDPYFGGQRTMELFASLARQSPDVYATPVTGLALGSLSYVQSLAVQYVRTRGSRGLELQCQKWLDAAAIDLQHRIDHFRFDEARKD